MYWENRILLGKSGDEAVCIYPKMANRHGMIAGATGTGKTVTLKVLAESFSDCGVPVFLADVKGDLAGMCNAGTSDESVDKRIESLNLNDMGFPERNRGGREETPKGAGSRTESTGERGCGAREKDKNRGEQSSRQCDRYAGKRNRQSGRQ